MMGVVMSCHLMGIIETATKTIVNCVVGGVLVVGIYRFLQEAHSNGLKCERK